MGLNLSDPSLEQGYRISLKPCELISMPLTMSLFLVDHWSLSLSLPASRLECCRASIVPSDQL